MSKQTKLGRNIRRSRNFVAKGLLLLSTIILLPLTQLRIANALWTQEVCTTFPKFGVTSLLKLPKSGKIISGTKGGKIFRSGSKDVTATSISWIQLEGDEYNCKYPIYSLSEGRRVNNNDSILFCSGGDRYISVWEPHQPQGDDKTTKYSCSKRLGPHTGWVKSLAYSNKSQLLYSIGCNCIDTWGWKNSSDTNDCIIYRNDRLKIVLIKDPPYQVTYYVFVCWMINDYYFQVELTVGFTHGLKTT